MAQQRGEFRWEGGKVAAALRKAAALGLGQWAEYVLQQARAIVPLDEATLERSGVASVDEETLTAAVSFDTPYAVVQHEDLTFRHAAGRSAKYLERPLMASKKFALPMIQKQMKKVTK